MKTGVLVIDTGSSSMRGILFDLEGTILASVQMMYTMTIGEDDSAVMEASVFSDCLRDICRRIACEARRVECRLLAVSLDSQRSSVLAVDQEIRPLHPILMWYDKRCAPICTGLSLDLQRTIYENCGMRVTPVSSAPKMLWLKRNHLDIYEKAYKLIGIHDYLLYTISGQLVTDATCACRTALMDIRTFDWSDTLLSIFEVSREKLCAILPGGSIVGQVTPEFASETGLPQIPVVSGGGDQQCCLLGHGEGKKGTISVNSGSASYIAIPVSAPVFDHDMEVNLSAYYGSDPWVLEASNMGSGTLYQWFNRIFYHGGIDSKDMEQINREVSEELPGCRGLICFADFAGRGCPATDPNARGMFLGVGLQHGRGSFARAVLEGICFDICGCIRHVQAMGVPVHQILSTGGLTNFPVFNQILADVTGMEVVVAAQSETTAEGTFRACLSALGIRERPREAGEKGIYRPEPQNAMIYEKIRAEREHYRKKLDMEPFTFN